MPTLIVCSVLALVGWGWLLRRGSSAFGGPAPTGAWHVGDAVFGGALSLYLVFTIFVGEGTAITITPEVVHGSLVAYALISSLVAFLAFGRGQSPQQAFGLTPSRSGRVFLIGVGCIVLTFPLVHLSEILALKLGRSVSDGDGMVQYLRGNRAFADFAWAIALAVIVAPVTEELVFRGYLYGVAKKYGGQVAAMLASALLFAAVHQNLPAFPAYFVLAIALTLAYELTGSLWTPIVMHMIFNLVPVVVILYFPQWIT